MAQDPWANDPIVPIRTRARDARQNEREQAETRYRNVTGDTNPLAQPVILPGENGYVGTRGQYLPQADVVVAGPWQSDPVVETPVADQSGFGAIGSFAQSAAEQIPFLDEAAAFTLAKLNGIPYEEARSLQAGLAEDDRANRRLSRNAGGIAGFAAGLAAPGGAYVRGASGVGQVGRAALVGAGYGGLYGSGAADDSYASRLSGGATGALVGGVGAGALQAATPYAARLAGIAGDAVRSVVPVGIARRAVERSGNVEGAAAMRLAGNLGPDQIAERQRLQSLGIQPTVLDTLDNTGERVIRTAAGPAGPGADAAVQNFVTRQASLKPEVMAVTRDLASDPRSAQTIQAEMTAARDALATRDYAPAYGAQVQLTPDALVALRGPDGEAIITRALRGAQANGDSEAIAELQSLVTADLDQLPMVSGRVLDRVRIAARDMSSNFMRGENPDRVMARGYAGRVEGIDTALDSAPGLVEARAAYRDASGAIDAIENRPDVFSTDPRDFASWVRGLTPRQREGAVIGVRQDILDQLGGQRNAGTGSLDTLSQAQYSQENLASLLGEDQAAQYLGSIRARVQQTQRAARVSPNTGSQTYGRIEDDANAAANAIATLVDGVSAIRGNPMAAGRLVDRARASLTMSPQEREAIVRLGLGSADDIERIIQLAEDARRSGRRAPREVRAWVVNTRNVLGADNPVTLQVERLLAPPTAAAQEED